MARQHPNFHDSKCHGVIVVLLAITLILAEMGVSLGPILAAAGIAGIAIGFGAQSLIKDVLNGFFVLLENHVRIGNWIETAGKEGTVEEMTL
jgi:small-conductance mechanosensitive channel